MRLKPAIAVIMVASSLCTCSNHPPGIPNEYPVRKISIDESRLNSSFDEISAENILMSLFGNFDKVAKSAFLLRKEIPVAKNSFLSTNEFRYFRATLHNTSQQKIAGHLFLLAVVGLVPDQETYDCHPCSVLPLVARFKKSNEEWSLVDRFFLRPAGGYGRMPSIEFVDLSPSMLGIITRDTDLHMGVLMSWADIYAYHNGQLSYAVRLPLEGSNQGECQPGARDCYAYKAKIRWLKAEDPYQIELKCTGTTPSYPNTPKKCPAIELYEFLDGHYASKGSTSPAVERKQ